jgi:hypothetical protein
VSVDANDSPSSCRREEERLLAHPVARRVQRSLVRVPDREGERAVEAVEQAVPSPDAESLEDHLGVAAGAEGHVARELGAELGVVVDRAVEHEHVASVGSHHRRGAGGRAPACAERGVIAGPETGVVGAAVHHRVARRLHLRLEAAGARTDVADDGAHAMPAFPPRTPARCAARSR